MQGDEKTAAKQELARRETDQRSRKGNAGLRFGQFVMTGALAVARVLYIVGLLTLIGLIAVGAASPFTSSTFSSNLSSAVEFIENSPTAVVGLIAACVAVDTLRQKQRADDRSALLTRIQWAMELTTNEDTQVQDCLLYTSDAADE